MLARIALSLALALNVASRIEAGAWTLPKGVNWLEAGFMFQETTERYFFDGRNQTRALFFEYVRGNTDRWEAKVQLPFFNIPLGKGWTLRS